MQPHDGIRAGRAYLGRSELALAVRAFREALRHAPEDLDAREGLGVALARAGEYDAALEELDRVCTRDSGRELARRTRGEVLMRLGRFDQAVAELKRAMGASQPVADDGPKRPPPPPPRKGGTR